MLLMLLSVVTVPFVYLVPSQFVISHAPDSLCIKAVSFRQEETAKRIKKQNSANALFIFKIFILVFITVGFRNFKLKSDKNAPATHVNVNIVSCVRISLRQIRGV